MIFQPLKLILIITNFFILSFLIVLMIEHYNSHYNRKSFAFIFHTLSLIWLLIRGIFWISTITIVGKLSCEGESIYCLLYHVLTVCIDHPLSASSSLPSIITIISIASIITYDYYHYHDHHYHVSIIYHDHHYHYHDHHYPSSLPSSIIAIIIIAITTIN